MTLSNNLSLYEDVRQHLDRALASRSGIQLTFPSRGQAVHFGHRINKFRNLEKEKLLEIYDAGDERRAFSVYQDIEVKLEGLNMTILRRAPVEVREL